MKIYTKTGDKGQTSLLYGERVSKEDIRVEAYGTCDEANSMIGLAISHIKSEKLNWNGKDELIQFLSRIQTILFHVGAELATPSGKELKWHVEEKDVQELENMIDLLDKDLPQLTNFILPGGGSSGATLHSARTIARRAERRAVVIDDVNKTVIAYLNRLSDFLFVAARYVNGKEGIEEPILHQD